MSERKISINEIQGIFILNIYVLRIILFSICYIFIYYINLKIQNQKKYYNFLKCFIF